MEILKKKTSDGLDKIAIRATRWIGSTNSLVIHTILFVVSFLLYFYGIAIEKILLVLTTIVSLEAIYLSIFIQMSVNRQARKLHAVARDVGEIQEDVDEIQKDVDEIQKDVDEIQEDVDEINEEDEEEEIEQKKDDEIMKRIEDSLGKLIEEVIELKKQNKIKKITKSNKKSSK
jgi:biopolymer transport protein ExbB/TolQ